ncbi:hypothetical protein MNBD_GAMMA12-2577 [hydrothermal vent metagenome]|uniref:Uncharacterized protein n=1 Tax=hydrothermal vent metagenome TaxID=652676 RepID=A0A3B0YR71_9ZZZZ
MSIVDRAFDKIDYYLNEAENAPVNNVEACIKYLRVAKLAIAGLGNEADSILIESHIVA